MKESGMKINTDKTMVMKIWKEENHIKIAVVGKVLEQVKSFI